MRRQDSSASPQNDRPGTFRIGLLPLDDRPCNRQFPRLLAQVVTGASSCPTGFARIQALIPPRSLLGHFLTPGKPRDLARWLEEKAPGLDALVVSSEMLLYGGLIASRTAEVPLKLALARLNLLAELRRRRPGLPLLAFGVIMRLTLTYRDQASRQAVADLFRYSQLADRRQRLGEPVEEELEEVVRRLPPGMREDYLAVRARNHAVNLALVELAGQGVLDYLVLAQEDAAPAGLHIPEQQELKAKIAALGAENQVAMFPGADEVGILLLARQACRWAGWAPRICVSYSTEHGARQVPRFEDRPICQTIQAHLTALGGKLTESADRADLSLVAHTFQGDQGDLAERPAADGASGPVQRAVKLAGGALDSGRPLAIADLAYANGGDPALLAALSKQGMLPRLLSIAGWNTAGNTIGTVLAHAALRLLGGGTGVLYGVRELALALIDGGLPPRSASPLKQASGDESGGKPPHSTSAAAERRRASAHYAFLFSRLVDDYLYQAQVRQELNHWLQQQQADPLHLTPNFHRRAEQYLARELVPRARLLWEENFAGRPLVLCTQTRQAVLESLSVRLPWPRTFELELEARVEV